MTQKQFILAFDAGTTSSRAILFDHNGEMAGTAQQEFPQIYPKPGWVEHDPMEIWATQSGVARQVLERFGVSPDQVAAIGITNQRETAVVWDRNTGKPVYNAIVWQDKRTAPLCEELQTRGLGDYIRQSTGLVIDSYFSATKIAWILDHVEGARGKAEAGELAFGTVDSWLIWNLTRGKVHRTDYSNASRTMLYNIHNLDWDQRLLDELGIPRAMMPEVGPSSGVAGRTDQRSFGGAGIPIAGIAGDQQAALFGQGCFESGMAKNTYGTGSFILMNTGSQAISSRNGLLTTIAWGIGDRVEYALEGSIFITGAAVQWLRDEMKVIHDASDSEYFANKVEDSGGVYVIPAFAGLGAPYWDMYARGTIIGITRGTTMNHIIRATLESLAYQVRDVADCMAADSGVAMKELKVDGGASANNFIMQFQADILGVPVVRPKVIETTARGAAFLAGLAVEFWKDRRDIVNHAEIDRQFEPTLSAEDREARYQGWQRAVQRSRGWVEKD
ncbi:glycerol kinase GlpK [Spirochaeta lutea]|uniref:Glycerol kinase n=1 Tax=Spirochaeta lutea TaxID=1480694 RepID=A0A098R143_9SPIO|nr:glycerol kinase GlpK [Spirochaeta lutea]KGE73393.1 glycerol kinase [Spirochaeta lutea]